MNTRSETNVVKLAGKVPKQHYTFGDAFCGAGGASCGAQMAGLHVVWGFDKDPHACKSFGLNFYKASIYQLEAFDFCHCTDECKVDILHLSPPCQPWSPAHTIRGKDDETNEASLFAIEAILLKAKPRVVAMENTAGLANRFSQHLNSVIQMFTVNGFSVRWKVVNCAEYGTPQARKRLIIIASWFVMCF
jgi:DNA (cytosine-5)-methyltransferase 1